MNRSSVFPCVHLGLIATLCSCAHVLFLFCIYLSDFLIGTMLPKKASDKESGEKKKRIMSMDLKLEMIEKHEQGVQVSDLAKTYDCSTSAICISFSKVIITSMNASCGILMH